MTRCLWRCWLIAPAMLGVGCATGGGGGEGVQQPQAANSFSADAPYFSASDRPGAQGPIRVVDLAFDVVRIDFPIGPHRHTQKIWNHVTAWGIDPDTSQRLERNGVRIGLASTDAWPAMVAIFKTAQAKIGRERLLAVRGQPLIIKLAAVSEAEPVFRYLASGQLAGKTIYAGDKLLSVDYWWHPQLGGSTDLRLDFEVRHEQGELTWERREGIVQQAPAVDREVFDEIAAVATLATEQFLVIGASDPSQAYLVGSRFLTRSEAAQSFETVLCIAPKAFQTDGDRPLSLGS